MTYAYYNGEFGKFSDIKIPLTDRTVFFGDGIYDAAIGKSGKIYLFEEHMDRLCDNAERAAIPLGRQRSEIEAVLSELAGKSAADCFFLYFQLSAYADERRHAPRDKELSNFLALVKPIQKPDIQKELNLISYPERRHGFCNIKTVNLLGSVFAAEAAHAAECDEAVFIDGVNITECSHSNISIISSGTLITHPADSRILSGIMRRHLLLTAKRHGIPVIERPFSLSELLAADDVLISSTSRLISRAKTLDGFEISGGGRALGDMLMGDMFKDFENFC